METKRRMEITIETHEVTTIRVSESHVVTEFCGICQMKTAHLPLTDTAAALGLSETAIFDLAEAGQIHFVQGRRGTLLICTNSLPRGTRGP